MTFTKELKEMFETVTQCGFIQYCEADFYNDDRIEYSTKSHILDGSYTTDYMTINDFFFDCIDFIQTTDYVFVQDTKGHSKIESKFNGAIFKIWKDKEYNKQRVFDACKWILENKDK